MRRTARKEPFIENITKFVFQCPKCHFINPEILKLDIKNYDLSNAIPNLRNTIEEPYITIKCDCEEEDSTFPLYSFIERLLTPCNTRFKICGNSGQTHENREKGRLYCIFCKKWLCNECLESHEEDEEEKTPHMYMNYEDDLIVDRLIKQWQELDKKKRNDIVKEMKNKLNQKTIIENIAEKIKQIFRQINEIHKDIEEYNLRKMKQNNKHYKETEKVLTDNFKEVNLVNYNLFYLYSMIVENYAIKDISLFWVGTRPKIIDNYLIMLYNYRFYSYSQTLENNDLLYNSLAVLQNNTNVIKPTVEKRFVKWITIQFEEKKYSQLGFPEEVEENEEEEWIYI